MDAEHFVEFGSRTFGRGKIPVVDDDGQRKVAEVVTVQLDFFDTLS